MAKNSIPGMETGGGVMSKVVGATVVLAILVIVIIRKTVHAARTRSTTATE